MVWARKTPRKVFPVPIDGGTPGGGRRRGGWGWGVTGEGDGGFRYIFWKRIEFEVPREFFVDDYCRARLRCTSPYFCTVYHASFVVKSDEIDQRRHQRKLVFFANTTCLCWKDQTRKRTGCVSNTKYEVFTFLLQLLLKSDWLTPESASIVLATEYVLHEV